jgi:YebC/PmpR family DNA-binding regulatory protein
MEGVSGHSKWAGIKHKKAIVDARRGAQFTKLARAITVAAREGGGELDANAALANAVQKAKDASMPKDNIERAIAKGTGAGADADAIETVLYEGYGPGGVALLIEAYTDNRNRTGADVRHLLSKHGGSLGEPGSVAYLFDKRGVISVDAARYDEEDLLAAVEAGALDIALDGELIEVICEPGDLAAVRRALEQGGIELESTEVIQRPSTRVELDEEAARRLFRLIEALEENDDVGEVHANFDAPEEVIEALAG